MPASALASRLIRGWGRLAAGSSLLAFVSVQAVAPQLFEVPRRDLFDLYERLMPRVLTAEPVVLVAIDDASLRRVGQWPWPRQLVARLIDRILAAQPLAVGADMIWPEPDRQSPEIWLRSAGPLPDDLGDALRRLPSHDEELAKALGSGPIAIGVAGVFDRFDKTPGRFPPVRRSGVPVADWTRLVPSYPAGLHSIPVLDRAAPGHGILSVDPDDDGLFRRLPLISAIAGQPEPGFGLEVLRLAAGAAWLDIRSAGGAISSVSVGPLTIPTQDDGSLWVAFTPHDPARFISAADILDGDVSDALFDHKIVLIGVNGLGQADQRRTPLGPMPGTEIQAQLIETIIAGAWPRRPDWARIGEPAITAAVGLLQIVVLPLIRPRWQVPSALVPLAFLGATGFAAWHWALLLLDVATPLIGQSVVLAALVGGSFAEADAQRRRLRRDLEARRLADARSAGELEAAKRIQMGILPLPASVADDARFDLAARMIPAREIGGDLYDFFKIDHDHLYLAVGDVSGKGVPASLFMALGKSLCKSCALRGERDIGAIVLRANQEISRDNPEMLFITLFAAVLNVATGEFLYCNAGHDAPFVIRRGAAPVSIEGAGGPPLCVVDDFPYATERHRLEPGDIVCLMTDGITEAMNRAGALMGRERVAALFGTMPGDGDAETVTDRLLAEVDRFVAGAEPSDDLTILTVRWHGPGEGDVTER